ncbi:ribonuclease toxin immunity protein CdiI [Niallia taxi]|uniref:ribonuclease toxin immunity protein CdiI n=1 Tax=Niallia TaxID=2837506 RepID=UPI00203B53A3|nr:ribonuclease toxin immunity protein CdiI [Niallia sp. MER 6]MCM3029646.1 ribonuclease toxin immunity protein CdiI [Niallia sp. MER 6]
MSELTEMEEKKLIKYYYFLMGDGRFLNILHHYSIEWGYGDEYAWYVFASIYEDWEEDYFGTEGVRYYLDYPAVEKDIEITLDYETFYRYLLEDCEEYLQKRPKDREWVTEYLQMIKEKFKIKG